MSSKLIESVCWCAFPMSILFWMPTNSIIDSFSVKLLVFFSCLPCPFRKSVNRLAWKWSGRRKEVDDTHRMEAILEPKSGTGQTSARLLVGMERNRQKEWNMFIYKKRGKWCGREKIGEEKEEMKDPSNGKRSVSVRRSYRSLFPLFFLSKQTRREASIVYVSVGLERCTSSDLNPGIGKRSVKTPTESLLPATTTSSFWLGVDGGLFHVRHGGGGRPGADA